MISIWQIKSNIIHIRSQVLILFLLSLSFCTYAQSSKTLVSQPSKEIDSIVAIISNSNEADSILLSRYSRFVFDKRYNKNTLPVIRALYKIADKKKDKKILSKVYLFYGNYYYYNTQLDSAKFMLEKAKTIADAYKLNIEKATSRITMAVIYRKKGDVSSALKLLQESNSILNSIDTIGISKSKKAEIVNQKIILNNTFANFYNQIENYDKAALYYDKAFNNAFLLHSYANAGVILSNKGNLLFKLKKYKEALSTFLKSKELKIKGNAPGVSIANANQNIGLALLELGRNKEALSSLNKAFDYYKKNDLQLGLMQTYEELGRVYYAIGDYNKSIENCIKSKDLAVKKGIIETQEKASLCLSKSYEAIGMYQLALDNYKNYTKIKDANFNKENIKKITQIEMQYQFEKENELQKLKNIAKENENKATINYLVFGILFLLFFSIFLYWINRIKHKTNNQLKEKNEQISNTLKINETLFKETHHRVKNNLQIISSLLNMQSKYLVDNASKSLMKDSQNRIKSMSLIHQKLYQNDRVTGIETQSYFEDLINSLVLSYGIDIKKVNMHIEIDNILLDVDTAIPLGLVMNELISNAFKHGVDPENGTFELYFNQIHETSLRLFIKDNGKGFNLNFDLEKSNSYGMKLIHTLGKKLKAKYSFRQNNGLEIEMLIYKFKIL